MKMENVKYNIRINSKGFLPSKDQLIDMVDGGMSHTEEDYDIEANAICMICDKEIDTEYGFMTYCDECFNEITKEEN